MPPVEKTSRRARKSGAPNRYRYVMTVIETVVYTTAVDSDKKEKLDELKDIAETRRVRGELSFQRIADVDTWLEEAYENGERSHADEVLAD